MTVHFQRRKRSRTLIAACSTVALTASVAFGNISSVFGVVQHESRNTTPANLPAAAVAASSLIRVNQHGYLPNAIKRASLVNGSNSPVAWQLRNSSGTTVLSGNTTVFGYDASSGDTIHIIDFSGYTGTGSSFTLAAAGNLSHQFDISATVYRQLKYDALAYFYHNRSGIAITMPYAGRNDLTRPAGHVGIAPNRGDTNVPCAPGTGCSYSLNVVGGWYDAGDHGKYVVNGGISVWTLLNQYERNQYLGSSAADFGDGRMSIPENSNGVADLLDEARWELDFMLRMQVPAGQPRAGMVHHKMHDANWTGIPLRPDQDSQDRVLRPPSTAATLNLAATAAQGSRIWRFIDPSYSARLLSAAETAWAAARANPNVIALDSDGTGGGSYGDPQVGDEFYWAASELYITTGKAEYKSYLQSSSYYQDVPSDYSSREPAMTWGTTEALGTISLAVVPSGFNSSELAGVRNAVISAATVFANNTTGQGYGTPFNSTSTGYPWGSNSFVLNNGIILGLAHDFTGNVSYLNAMSQGMDYLLGRNAMDKSYVTGYGENPLQNPHHRFWAFQANSGFPRPPAGAVSGGPNSALQDPYAQSIGLPGCKAQKCFVDHIESWSTNEITINWNAPLAWVAAYLDEKAGSVTPPTATPIPATATPIPATATPRPATATPIPATATPIGPTATATPIVPTATPRPATATPVPTSTPIVPTQTNSSCQVTYTISNQWPTGFTADVVIKNNGAAINGWNLAWTYSGNQFISNLWNGNVSQAGQAVNVTNVNWNGYLGTGATASFGMQASFSGTNTKPTAFSLNGVACSVTP
ncbi:glycoside hydrolase family 9 protein [Herpetosiphon gulosus]|uniref:Endoglucanase n=1 Tax=Herpetosiphon gulosus TaxID=1973496 RepID=A0ABP9WVY6_9CHLR